MESQIKVYGTSWCGDTRRARSVFQEQGIEYEWIDISSDAEAAAFVERVNNGYRSVPTIVFPNGDILVEPPVSNPGREAVHLTLNEAIQLQSVPGATWTSYTLEEFEAFVAEALAELPRDFQERLENIQIEVREWPSRRELVLAGLRPGQMHCSDCTMVSPSRSGARGTIWFHPISSPSIAGPSCKRLGRRTRFAGKFATSCSTKSLTISASPINGCANWVRTDTSSCRSAFYTQFTLR